MDSIKLNKQFIRYIKIRNDKVYIYLINQTYIKDNFNIGFTEGGHHWVGEGYLFIPENEIWISQDLNEKDREAAILHEATEYELMKFKAMDYDSAHDISNEKEQEFRNNEITIADSSKSIIPLTFEEFKRKLPVAESPYAGESGIVYKPAFNKYTNQMAYWKNGRRTGKPVSLEYIYKESYLYLFNKALKEKTTQSEMANKIKLSDISVGDEIKINYTRTGEDFNNVVITRIDGENDIEGVDEKGVLSSFTLTGIVEIIKKGSAPKFSEDQTVYEIGSDKPMVVEYIFSTTKKPLHGGEKIISYSYVVKGGDSFNEDELSSTPIGSDKLIEPKMETKLSPYIAFYKGKKYELRAESKYKAVQEAAKYFKAKKTYEVTVELATEDEVITPDLKSSSEIWSISYLDKNNRHKETKKEFFGKNAYEEAMKWGKENLDNFNLDMLRLERSNIASGTSERQPKFKVGDYVFYEGGDVYKERWDGVIKEVLDFDTEYAYNVDAYGYTEDGLMFDKAKNNQKYEIQLRWANGFQFSKKEKEYNENKQIKNVDKPVVVTQEAIDSAKKFNELINNKKETPIISESEAENTKTNELDLPTLEYVNKYINQEAIKIHGKVTRVEGVPFEKEWFRLYFENGFEQKTKIPKGLDVIKPTSKSKSKFNQYTINQQIEKLVQENGTDRSKYSESELAMLGQYSGHGGLKDEYMDDFKAGNIKDLQGFLHEFYTPEMIVEKMWGLAYKHGFEGKKGSRILEPSCGIGRFIKLVPNNCEITAFEIDKTSAIIAKVLYPKATINKKSFESEFFMGSESLGNVIRKKYHLVIGNPPYGDYNSEYSTQEKKHTQATQIDHYFIMRGVDSLLQDGLLIFIIPSAFLQNDNKYNEFKELLSKKVDLIDAYRLPENAFDNTSIGTDIIVLRKK